jgi:hypothetical protein
MIDWSQVPTPCRKIRYETRRSAVNAARRHEQTKTKSGRQHPYHCPFCDGWHMTSQQPAQRKLGIRRRRRVKVS